MDVGDWLRSLGLAQYEAAFRENEIDAQVLPNLTAEDLKELGVTIVGHRRKMLTAIGELSARTAAKPGEAADPHSYSGERRQLTVMFCDIVGSTALTARLDPEDMREIVRSYQKCCAEAIGAYEGFVALYLGDGVVAYFGYPQAHEDDAERAVRAGFDLIAAVARLEERQRIEVRVGIATGLVVVGDLVGEGSARERAVTGETPILAARLQELAAPGTIVVSASTRRLLGNIFEFKEMAPRKLKGITTPVQAWTVLRASSVASRFEALHPMGLLPLVGRAEELELLLRCWSNAKGGAGQVMLVSGEAGIGKSRLTTELLERLAGEPHTRLRYFCSPQHTNSVLYPIIGQMERAAGLALDDTAQQKLDKLDATVALIAASKREAALFADMLSLPNDGRHLALDLTPLQRRQELTKALISHLEVMTRHNPVLMILEDAHWADPTTLEVFGRVLDRIGELSAVLIVTFRPDFKPPWSGRPRVTALSLDRLAQHDAGTIIDRLEGDKLIPAGIRQDIIERSDGIPLFIEEMTKAVLEADGEGEAMRTAAAVPSAAMSVPATLQASLNARLDRLGSAKEVAQIGAAIGREFSYALLAAVTDKTELELRSGLDRLVAAGLMFREGLPPQAKYLFNHALMQDAAYGTLLRQTRRELHRRIAEALESEFPAVVGAQPDVVAHHFTEAAIKNDKAAAYWLKAGEQALGRSAMTEAIAHLQRGLTLIPLLPEGEPRNQIEFELQNALGKALIATKGYTVPATIACFARARELCALLGDPPQVVPVLHGQWTQALMRNELGSAARRAAEILGRGETRKDAFWTWMGCRSSGVTAFARGEFLRARGFLERGLALYPEALRTMMADKDSAVVMRLTLLEGHVVTMTYLSWVLLYLGYFDDGRRLREAALQHAREASQAYPLAHAVNGHAFTELLLNAPQSALQQIDELAALTEQHRISFYGAMQDVFRGWCLARLGKPAEGISILTRSIALYRQTGTLVYVPTFLRLQAEALAMGGEFQRGFETIDESLRMIEQAEARVDEAEAHRIRGLLFLAIDERERAEHSYRLALEVADRQSAQLYKLRAATDMARLWIDDGKGLQALSLLAPIYDSFSQGFDLTDLKEAAALLETLQQSRRARNA